MFVVLVSLAAALVTGQQSQTTAATAGVAPAPVPAHAAPAVVSTATTTTSPVATLGAGPSVAGERVVCTNTQVTGSRFPIRRCRTVGQMSSERNEARDQLHHAQVNRLPSS